jgi:DNA-binding IclR family transcriptional regulator
MNQDLEPRSGASGGPKAMTRVLRLFDLLARQREGMSLSEISAALDVPKSTFLGSLRALAADGYLICNGGSYRLGPAAYRLAGTIQAGFVMPDIVRHYVRDLASRTRESVGFAIVDWDLGQAIYIDAINSTQPVHYAMRAGIRAPLYASASGRVLLAYASEEQRAAYFARAKLRKLTSETVIEPVVIEHRLEEIRTKGYCASFGEMLPDTAAIAMPIFDPLGHISGSLMLAAPIDRLKENFDTLLGHLLEVGHTASGHPTSLVMTS